MKKSTIAVATLLTALSTAPVMSVAYADEQAPAPAATAPAATATDCKASDCKAADCKAADCKAAGASE